MRVEVLLLACAWVGCASNAVTTGDVANHVELSYDISCAGQAPTTAPDPMSFAGWMQDGPMIKLPGITVEMRSADNTVVASSVTDDEGKYQFLVPTGGVPLDGYLHMAGGEYMQSTLFAARPFHEDIVNFGVGMKVVSKWTKYALMVSDNGILPGLSTIWIDVVDCAGDRVSAANITLDPPAENMAELAPGKWLAVNVPAGPVHIVTEAEGYVWQDSTFQADADTLVMFGASPVLAPAP